MRFFVPGSNDNRQGEERFHELRSAVEAEAGPVKDERIYSLRYEVDGKVETATVGGDSAAAANGGPVLAVFEGDGAFYLCRGTPGGSSSQVDRVDRGQVRVVQKFTALA